MKKSRFTEAQIVSALKKQEAGNSTREICRELGVTETTFYNWKAKYGGMEISNVKKMKSLEEENARSKRDDQELSEALQELAFKHSSYGFRKLFAYLRRSGNP